MLELEDNHWYWRCRYSVFLLYWVKSTNTDAEGAARERGSLDAKDNDTEQVEIL